MKDGVIVKKGTDPETDSYSALFNNTKKVATELVQLLLESGISDVFVCGLATDVCVGATVKDALLLGYRTILVDDAVRGITVEGIEATKRQLLQHHTVIVKSSEVKNMVAGTDRRPELGLKLALEIQKRRKK
ncbi:Pyrazinamidase/nicotinamidase [Orchesella cincta]|uniref:nicotinamidase n=1 Tax=Orchesella cincta TaxID=48709 RepID=A0A1D2MQP0_ORCCI|nr:Pyrazinamidase/nicotinamidase [Orchesella cincta]